jgi:hypothetical protein
MRGRLGCPRSFRIAVQPSRKVEESANRSLNECIALIWSDRVNTAKSVGVFL